MKQVCMTYADMPAASARQPPPSSLHATSCLRSNSTVLSYDPTHRPCWNQYPYKPRYCVHTGEMHPSTQKQGVFDISELRLDEPHSRVAVAAAYLIATRSLPQPHSRQRRTAAWMGV